MRPSESARSLAFVAVASCLVPPSAAAAQCALTRLGFLVQEPGAAEPPGNPAPAAPAAAAKTQAPTLDALAERVLEAHGAPPAGGIKAFRATIRMDPLRQGTDRVSAVLDVKYLTPGYLRYTFESERNVERGIDATGSWTKIDGKVEHHGGRTSTDDQKQVQQHLRLAKLYLRFLDPAAILRELENPEPVREGPLRIGRAIDVQTWIVEGDVAAFPIWARQGDPGQAHLKLYFDRESARLVAVRAVPIGKEPEPGQVVAIAPDAWQERKGDQVLLPSQLVLYTLPKPSRRGGGDETLVPEAKISLTNLDLSPKLTKADFKP